MLTINYAYSPYNIHKANNTQKIQQKKQPVTSPAFKQNFDFFTNYYDIYESLQEKPINTDIKTDKRPPYNDSTIKILDSVFDNYKANLQEITPKDINTCITNIKNKTNATEQEILSSMQQATQFANMQSLETIEKELNKNDICYLLEPTEPQIFENCFNINGVLSYLFKQKKLGYIKGTHRGTILDKNTINHLENSQAQNPDFKPDDKIKYFILSGFNDGINFINRTKNLEQTTIDFLQKEPDKELLKRAEKLGIKPIIIKNQKEPTIENIYTQLCPEQMTKEELKSVIDATVMTRLSDTNEQVKTKKDLAQYLKNQLIIYTPEKFSQEIQKMHLSIKNEMAKREKSLDDVVYLIDDPHKSSLLVNYQYQHINNIPADKFAPIESINDTKYKDKTIVVLDDCSISGASILKIREKLLKTKKDIIYAPVYTSEKAYDEINSYIFDDKKEKLIRINPKEIPWNNNINTDNESILITLGEDGFDGNYSCLILPHMAPDNNSEFAANIALLHHIGKRYLNNNETDLFRYLSIKSLTQNNLHIAQIAQKLLNTSKVTSAKD